MQAAPLITEELLDEDFFAELDALIDKDFEENKEIQEESRNCGTGAIGGKQGFQPGNKCAGDGSKSKAKAEGKKKDVHSDWDDGKTAAEAGWYYTTGNMMNGDLKREEGVERDRSAKNMFSVSGKDPTGIRRKVNIQIQTYAGDYEEGSPRSLMFDVDGYYKVTDRGMAMTVMREVSNRTVSLFEDPAVGGLGFSASKEDGIGRTKLYTTLAKKLAKKVPGAKAWVTETDDDFEFTVTKKSFTPKFHRWMDEERPEITFYDDIIGDGFDPRDYPDSFPSKDQ